MMTITNEKLSELETAEAKVTPGDWDAYYETGLHPFLVTFTEDKNGFRAIKEVVPSNLQHLEFVALARNNLKVLIETVRYQRKLNTELNRECEIYRRERDEAHGEYWILKSQNTKLREELKAAYLRNGFIPEDSFLLKIIATEKV